MLMQQLSKARMFSELECIMASHVQEHIVLLLMNKCYCLFVVKVILWALGMLPLVHIMPNH